MSTSDAPPTGGAGATDDAKALVEAARDLVVERVLPDNARLEAGDRDVLRALLLDCGRASLLALAPRDERAAEPLGTQSSVAIASAAHATLATAAIARFGSEAARATLDARGRAEIIGGYALTEAEGGSDPLSMRTRARRDGTDWIVTGRKHLVTNAALLDDVVVFAHADGAGPVALLVPRTADGVTIGADETLLGVRGASIADVVLQDVRVAHDALLDAPGQGHRVAVGVAPGAFLRVGTLAVGHARFLACVSARRARERRQFGQPISAFGAVAALIGEMVARAFVAESLVRRATSELDGAEADDAMALSAACKVLGAEMVARVAELALRVHAAHGLRQGRWPEQSHRDVTAYRCYEGTNEVNRRTAYGALRKLVVRGTLVLDRDVLGDASNRERSAARSLAAWLRVATRSSLRAAAGAGDAAMAGRDELETYIAHLAFASAGADAAQARARAANAAYASDAHLVSLAADAGVLLVYQDVMPASQALRVALGREVPALPLPNGAGPALDLPAALVALGRAAVEAGGDPLAPYEFPVLPNT